jgi:Flp pilus assembly protein TadG
MRPLLHCGLWHRAGLALRRIRSDTRGAAAVEFAYLAPILVLMLLGTIEVGRAVNIDRHFSQATNTAGDLVAREEYLGTSDGSAYANLESMMDSIEHIMHPYDTQDLKLGVFSVRADPDNPDDTRVEWSYSFNEESVPATCDLYSLPAGLVSAGGSVIVVTSTYIFKPLFADVVPGISGNMTWTDKSFHSPRNSCVDYVKGDNCSSLSCG